VARRIEAAPATSIAVRYVGSGELIPGAGEMFIGGVPARDLTGEEWGALREDVRALCLKSGVYQLAGPAAPGEPAEG
jgi:hypothetical protein